MIGDNLNRTGAVITAIIIPVESWKRFIGMLKIGEIAFPYKKYSAK